MPKSTRQQPAAPDATEPPSTKARLLIVDDELDTRGLLEYRFAREGFEVETARNGKEALRKARTFHPALIILDIALPDLDGFSVCDALRTEPETARTPIVLLSSHSGISISARAVESGIRYCFSKCTDLKVFIQAVRDILAAQPLAAIPSR
jgi:DNA-binding response OmpR family regulator